MPPKLPETRWPRLWLRRADQAVVAGIVAIALAALVGHWIYQGGLRQRMLEVDRVEPGTIEFIVDINSAPWPELTVVPGVGETLAKRIVERREQVGPYRDLDELREIRGIGPRVFERIKPYLIPLPDAEATAGVEREKSLKN